MRYTFNKELINYLRTILGKSQL